MNPETIRRLNAINRRFYEVTAEEFDQTRGQSWPGWEALLPYLPQPVPVLDLGCGNGRFGRFLADHWGADALDYHGVDNNAALLRYAESALTGIGSLRLEQRDLVENPLKDGQYGLVVIFGVMHHIPGMAQRRQWLQSMAQRVQVGGILAFACWRFYEYERFRKRLSPFPPDIIPEAHDYLLDWRRGEHALRYCHYVDDVEHANLIEATGFEALSTYRADGFSGAVNQYSILRRPAG